MAVIVSAGSGSILSLERCTNDALTMATVARQRKTAPTEASSSREPTLYLVPPRHV